MFHDVSLQLSKCSRGYGRHARNGVKLTKELSHKLYEMKVPAEAGQPVGTLMIPVVQREATIILFLCISFVSLVVKCHEFKLYIEDIQ